MTHSPRDLASKTDKTIFLSAPDMSGRERDLVTEVFDSNYIAPAGQMLGDFESIVAEYTGIKYAVAVSSGTAALHLALHIAGIIKNDTVWTSSMTFIGGVSPIIYQGAKPHFFDVSPKTWTVDIDLLEENLSIACKTGKLPTAIVPTDLYGQACDIERLVTIADQYNIKIVSDSAESLGSFINGSHAGKVSLSTILSFNGNKIITTSGGGMLLSDDENFIKQARYLSTQARQNVLHYEHTEIGYNYRMSNICAAIGVGQMETLESKVEKRRSIFNRYVNELEDFDFIEFMPETANSRNTRWLTCLKINGINAETKVLKVLEDCAKENIETRPLWKPMHLQPVFKQHSFTGPGYCEHLFETGLCLPSGSGMSEDEQTRVIDTIKHSLEQ